MFVDDPSDVVDALEVEVVVGAKSDVTNDSATENIDPKRSVCAAANCAANNIRNTCREAMLTPTLKLVNIESYTLSEVPIINMPT